MPLDMQESIENNFGFDRNFIFASSDIRLLIEWKMHKQSLLCRRPDSSETAAYVEALTTEDRFYERMNLLHKIPFKVSLEKNGELVWGIAFEESHLRQITQLTKAYQLAASFNIAELFPEREAKAFVDQLEIYARESIKIHQPSHGHYPIAYEFHTMERSAEYFHVDIINASVRTFKYGTIIAPFAACALVPSKSKSNQYECLDASQLVEMQPGDILLARDPHIEGFGKCRLAVKTYCFS